MLKEEDEEASALMGLLAASPPYTPATYGCDSPQPLESESYAPTNAYSCDSPPPPESESYAPPNTDGCDWPQPLVYKSESDSPPRDCYCPDSPYSPVPPGYEWPVPLTPSSPDELSIDNCLWLLGFKGPERPEYEAPPYISSAPSYMPQPLGSECHSPLPLEAESESESFASSPSLPPSEGDAPPYALKIESESETCGSLPSPPPSPLESECLAPPSAPTTTGGCHSPLPLEAVSETESFASSPSPPPSEGDSPPDALKIESETGGSSPSPPPSEGHSPQPLESECCAPTYAPTTSNEYECAYAPTIETPLTTSPLKKYGEIGLYGQIGLQCYNLHKGTNLQFLDVAMFQPIAMFASRIIIEAAEEPIGKSTWYLDIEICHTNKREGCREIILTRCFLQPEVKRRRYERLVVDDFFKGVMPTWISEDALTGSCKRQYYELTKSEVEQDQGWLHLYALLAYLALELQLFPEQADQLLELRKVVVQTKEDVEPKKKANAMCAVFYISFRSSAGQDFNAIIRRTTVEFPEHMKLEFKCYM
ncbi:unnamed protein product [Thlaspi arvense]|uniref:Uncharacterized protein n=1 Tax=Thlaspi arvense TaxID=13288 RepID=A0AAU9SNP0_THLAR|nr:unnamed protein product [Thlaspi arvense]